MNGSSWTITAVSYPALLWDPSYLNHPYHLRNTLSHAASHSSVFYNPWCCQGCPLYIHYMKPSIFILCHDSLSCMYFNSDCVLCLNAAFQMLNFTNQLIPSPLSVITNPSAWKFFLLAPDEHVSKRFSAIILY